MQLRYYQQEALDALYLHLSEKTTNPCVVIPTGGGKTPLIATFAREATAGGWRVLIVAHVKELLQQAVDKLLAIDTTLDVGVYSAGLKSRDKHNRCIVAGIQSIYNKAFDLGEFDAVLMDECFLAGTLIDTPQGPTPIEEIYVGQPVYNATGVGLVSAMSARKAREIYEVRFDDGTSIQATGNHPIFTNGGWKQIRELDVGEIVHSLQGVRMLWNYHHSRTMDKQAWSCFGDEGINLEENKVLFDILFEEVGEPDVHSVLSRKNEGDSPKEITIHQTSRRQWEAASEAAFRIREYFGRGMGGRICDQHAPRAEKRLSDTLQDRLGSSEKDDCDRTRGAVSPNDTSSPTGCKENKLPGSKRVVSVTCEQRPGEVVVYNLQVTGHPSYFANGILAHNCHLIPPSGDGMYRTLIDALALMNPKVRIIGLTATPYRMSTGMICGEENILNEICYEVGVRDLISQGYLSPLIGKQPLNVDTSKLHVKQGEFVASECESLMTGVTAKAIDEVMELGRSRRSILVFASGVAHAEKLREVINGKDPQNRCEVVTGETMTTLRDEYVKDFKAGEIRWLVNVAVFTTGFDAPNVDCVVLMRPTLSPGLYYQMVGRGFRLSPGKEDCLILDFGGNLERHGPVDQVKPRHKREGDKRESNQEEGPHGKKCPKCLSVVAINYQACPMCGYEWPPKITEQASVAQVVSQPVLEKYDVKNVVYSVHTKRNAELDAPRTMRVEYVIGNALSFSEWICVEHANSWVVGQAEKWWKLRCKLAMPRDAEQAVMAADEGLLAFPKSITVKIDGSKFPKVVDYQLGPIPDPSKESTDEEWDGFYKGEPVDLEDAPF